MFNLEKKLLAEKITEAVMELTADGKMDTMDAVLLYAEKNDIDIEVVAAAIKSNAVIISKIQEEAEDLNFLPKQNRLPI